MPQAKQVKTTPAPKKAVKAAPVSKKEAGPSKTKKATKTESKVATKETAPKTKPEKRSFKICRGDGTFSSRLMGRTPKQAANKALTALLREAKREGKVDDKKVFKAEFTIRETTRGSKGKEFSYVGTREKLAEPSVYSIKSGDSVKEIVNNFRNKVLKAKV